MAYPILPKNLGTQDYQRMQDTQNDNWSVETDLSSEDDQFPERGESAEKASEQVSLILPQLVESKKDSGDKGSRRSSRSLPLIELPVESRNPLRTSRSHASLDSLPSVEILHDAPMATPSSPVIIPRQRSKTMGMPKGLQKIHDKSSELFRKDFKKALQDLKEILSDQEVGMLSPRSPRGQEMEDVTVDTLILEFLKDAKGEEAITSPEGKEIIKEYIKEILEKYQDAYPDATTQLAKHLWKADSTQSAIACALKKIIIMNKAGKKLPEVLHELLDTELKFHRRLSLLSDKKWDGLFFFEMLKKQNLIDEVKLKLLGEGWEELSKSSVIFLDTLVILKDKKATPEEKMDTLVEYIKSDDMKKYYACLETMVQKYAEMDEALNQVAKDHSAEWKEIVAQFKKNNSIGDSIEDPKSILAEPFQRVGRFPLLMEEIVKNSQFFPKEKVESLSLSLGLLKLRSKKINLSLTRE